MSMNNYSAIHLTDTFVHSNLKQLTMNDNKIRGWEEFIKLSHAFPNLQALIATSNPLQKIPPISSEDTFPSLSTLNLNGSDLCTWQCVENLHALAQLKELSVLKIPLGAEMKEKQRRQAFVARLPRLSKLNKSTVTETERETAERWFVREMADRPDPPPIYQELLKKHGKLDPLADVNLNPVKMVAIKFHFDSEERSVEERTVNVDQTLWDFKKWIAEDLVGMPVASFRLWYCGNLLKHNQKYLYTYRLHNGDKIHIEMK